LWFSSQRYHTRPFLPFSLHDALPILLRVQNAVEELEKVLRRDELPLRHVAELGSRGQENGRRELGQEMLGNVELDVEPVQIALLLREDLVDVRSEERRVGKEGRARGALWD